MRLPPIRNAILTQVQAGGGAEDYDQPAAGGPVKWSGSEDVFVNDQATSVDAGERSSILVERSVVVDDALDVDWARGDMLTYAFRGASQVGVVQDVKTTTAPGLPGVVRLILENA